MAGLHYDITMTTDQARQQLRNIQTQVRDTAQQIESAGVDIDNASDRMAQGFKRVAGAATAAFGAKELVTKLATVRGEFQQLEIAFETMLGNADKANKLMQQLTHTAAITPFGMQDVTGGAKQLLAYGLEAEKINETLIRLGDIAAGLSIPLGDLTYLYGTTMTQGRLYMQDFNQFVGRGIPLTSELAKQFGVAEKEVRELVEAGRVGFPEIQKVIESMTNVGGKFGGLMEAQSKAIIGQIANIEDAIDVMFNELGQQSEGVINATLSGVRNVVENYERFGRILLSLVGTYGVYRTAVMLNAATVGWATKAEALHYNWLLLVEKAQKALNATMLKNPFVLVATAIAGVIAMLASLKTESERVKEATEKYNQAQQEAIDKEQERRREMEKIIEIAGDEALSTATRREALIKLENQYPSIFEKYKTEYEMLQDLANIKRQIAEIDDKNSVANPKNELANAEKRIAELEAKARRVISTAANSVAGGMTLTTNALTLDEKAELKALQNRRDELKKNIRKDEVDKYFANLTGLSNADLEAQIKTRKELLAKMELSVAKVARLTGNRNTEGVYTADELRAQEQQLEREMNRRNAERQSSLKWATEAEKAYQKALKAHNDFISSEHNSLTKEEYDEQLKTLKENLAAAKKVRDKYQVQTDSGASKSIKEAAKRAEAEKESAELVLDIQRDNQKSETALMKEGVEKRLRQIEDDYNAQEDAIKKRAEKLKELNKKAGKGGELDPEQASVVAEARRLNNEQRKRETAQVYKVLADQYQSYADKRLAIERQFNLDIKALEEARKKAIASGDTENASKYARSIAEAQKAKGNALISHDLEVLQQSPDYIRAFEDLRSTSTETLTALVRQFEAAKEAAAKSLNPENLREYTATIQQMMDEIDRRNPFEVLATAARELADAEGELAEAERRLDTVKGGGKIITSTRIVGKDADGNVVTADTYLSLAEALQEYTKAKDKHGKASNKFVKAEDAAKDSVTKLTTAIKSVGDALGDTAGEVSGLILNIGTFVADTINGIQVVQKTGVDAVSAVEKASVILALVSTALQLLKGISELGNNAFAQYEAYAEKIADINALTDATNQYRLAVLEARQEEDRWFAEDGLANLKAWREYHDEVYKAYIDKATEAQAIYKNEGGGGWLTGALNWMMGNLSGLSWWNEWRDLWGQGGYKEGTTAAIGNLRIETRKKSGGFLGSGIGGHSQKTEDLVEWARKNGLGELFDDKGLINTELAQALIDNYGDKLVGQTKDTLEALMKLREQYDEYLEQLHEYVSALYAPLVDNFVDSLWAWLDEGKDALDAFKDYASDTFRDIVSDMLRTIVLDKVVGSFSDDISAIYERYAEGKLSEEELMGEVAKLTEGLIGRYETNLPALEGVLNNIYTMLGNAGIDLKNSSTSQQASSGAFTTMSEDTGAELSGRFTAFAESNQSIANSMITAITTLYGISATMTSNNSVLRDMLEQTVASNEYLRDIAKQTKPMLKVVEKLDVIIKNTAP